MGFVNLFPEEVMEQWLGMLSQKSEARLVLREKKRGF
jgi:hypothetical protein